MTTYLGIDVSKAMLDVVLLREGQRAEAEQLANSRPGFNRLHHFLKKRRVEPLHVGLCQERWGVSTDQRLEMSSDHRSKCPLKSGLNQVTGITSSGSSCGSLASSAGLGRPNKPARRFSLSR